VAERDPWLRREPGVGELRVELRRLARRALRRPLLVVGIALAMSLVMVKRRADKPEVWYAEVSFRISEGVRANTTPRPTKEIREYVESVVLSSRNLEAIMRRHGLDLEALDEDAADATAEFKSNFEVWVKRNYFLEDWQDHKSARLTLVFWGGSSEEVRAVLADAADVLVAEETRRRGDFVAAALAENMDVGRVEREQLQRRERRISEIEVALAGNPSPSLAVVLRRELIASQATMSDAHIRLAAVEKSYTDLRVALLLEANQLAVRFEKIDESVTQDVASATLLSLIKLGLVVFLALLPLVVISVGAFDSRIYDLEDVRRLGMVGVGHVPRFAGDDQGSLSARARARG